MRYISRTTGELAHVISISAAKCICRNSLSLAATSLVRRELRDARSADRFGSEGLLRSERGLGVVEWMLVLGAVIVPLAAFIYKLMGVVARFYSFDSWLISLPFP